MGRGERGQIIDEIDEKWRKLVKIDKSDENWRKMKKVDKNDETDEN